MHTCTVNIAFQKELLKEIDEAAKSEFRNRSELVREAARLYLDRKKRWNIIFSFGDEQRIRLGLKEEDIDLAIRKRRAEKRKRR